jgi:diguanylate cyclase
MDLELKKKLANTLSRYELKYDKMQLQISALKNVINQLILSPGITYEKDEHFSQLQVQLDAEFDPVLIEKKVNRLVHVIDKLERKKIQKKQMITDLITKGMESIDQLASKSQDKKAISKLQKMLEDETENHLLLQQFNEALTLCVASVVRELKEQAESLPSPSSPNCDDINTKVNASLQQLLEHLSIPQDLDQKREHIKTSLDHKLTSDDLSRIIDGLTKLVVDAFNVEQNRFKTFLQQLTHQLNDFDLFFKKTAESRSQASDDSHELEQGIQGDIDQIKNHLDTSTTIEELSSKITTNLKTMGERITEYRILERRRDEAYEEQVKGLQSKLAESEQNAEEIKHLLSFQKSRMNHDSLTGLPNRESYDEHISEALQRWNNSGLNLSLAVGDIDHFKQINDTFGHLAGDKVLKKVALIFKSSIRDVDFIARFGGEEFVFIFEETYSKAAFALVEKMRKAVKDCQFIYRENKVDVTVSFGLTTVIEGDNIESLFMRADNALYKAKNAGRNRSKVL